MDVERFWNYYESIGWKIKGNPVTNWKALMNNWFKNTYPNNFSEKTKEEPEPEIKAEDLPEYYQGTQATIEPVGHDRAGLPIYDF